MKKILRRLPSPTSIPWKFSPHVRPATPAPRRSPASPWSGSACRSAGPGRRPSSSVVAELGGDRDALGAHRGRVVLDALDPGQHLAGIVAPGQLDHPAHRAEVQDRHDPRDDREVDAGGARPLDQPEVVRGPEAPSRSPRTPHRRRAWPSAPPRRPPASASRCPSGKAATPTEVAGRADESRPAPRRSRCRPRSRPTPCRDRRAGRRAARARCGRRTRCSDVEDPGSAPRWCARRR